MTNHLFFAREIPESFYWAGFIAADGCVFENKNGSKYTRLALSIKDLEHINLFKNTVRYGGKISITSKTDDYGKRSFAGIAIYSKQWFQDLSKFNIVPNKTFIYKMPEWLKSHEYLHHFLRGYVDGDGSFWHTTPKNNRIVKQLGFNICGTYEFIQQCCEIFHHQCKLKLKTPRQNKSIYTLEYVGNNITTNIKDFLYKNAKTSLNRKYKIAFEHIDKTRNNCKKVVGTNILDNTSITFNSVNATAEYGFSPQLVSKCCLGIRNSHKGYRFKHMDKIQQQLIGDK